MNDIKMKIACAWLISAFPLMVQGIMGRTSQPSVTKISSPMNIGESPVWDHRVGKLFFVNIHHGQVWAYDYEKQSIEIAAEYPGKDVSPIILTKTPNVMLAGINRNLARITLFNNTAEPEIMHTVEEEKPKNRFNDGKADKRGRVWIGTISEEASDATLFKFTKDNIRNPTIMIPNVTVSNGLTWSPNGKTFYYIDTHTAEIAKYDYNEETGDISNRNVVFSTKGKNMGYPDGMTIDENGNLWIALWGGGSVIQVDPSTGNLLQRIPIPSKHTTSVAWGGPNMDILFVTTANRDLSESEKGEMPGAGSLYAVTNLGFKGLPDFEADI